jgi:hypothetical protein
LSCHYSVAFHNPGIVFAKEGSASITKPCQIHRRKPVVSMTVLLADSRPVKLLSQGEKAQVTVSPSIDCFAPPGQRSVCTVEAIHLRAETITPLLKEIPEIRPPSHWGINE